MRETAAIFDIKSTRIDVLIVALKEANTELLNIALFKRFGKMQDASCVPLLLELTKFDHTEDISLEDILPVFKRYNLNIIGIRHTDKQFQELATEYGLAFYLSSDTKNATLNDIESKLNKVEIQEDVVAQQKATEQTVTKNSSVQEAPATMPFQAAEQSIKTAQLDKINTSAQIRNTMVIDKPIRTGQQIYAKNADLIVLEMVSPGAEILADGNIHVYGPLRGRALAGVKGNKKARIFVQCMQAELVSVAGMYRVIEQNLPQDIANKAAQIYIEKDKLVIKALKVK